MPRAALRSAWQRWQRAAGPWVGWVVCPCLMFDGDVASRPAADHVSVSNDVLRDTLALGNTAVVLDLHAVMGVQLAAEVSRQRLACVVLVLPRWPHAEALLETQQLASALVAARLATEPPASTNVVFVLDAERRIPIRHRARMDARVDNRYELTASDLPNLATLRRAGIQRVVKVSAGA